MNQSDDLARARLVHAIRLADDALVLGQRVSEWCGKGPFLEEDIALANVALDLIGQARLLYAHASVIEGRGRTEDDYAYRRDVLDFRNHLLVEQPNRDFGHTIARQVFFDAWQVEVYSRLARGADRDLAAIAAKSVKESSYHLNHGAEWLVRLGDGTDESHARAQRAIDELWMWTGELFETDAADRILAAAGMGVDADAVRAAWNERIDSLLAMATLTRPRSTWMQRGGRHGEHTEHLGYLLAEMQSLARAHPDATAW